jgi:hypothetical protein
MRHRHVGKYRTRKGIVKKKPIHKHMVLFRKDLGEKKNKITNKDFGKAWYKADEVIDEKKHSPFDEPRKMLVHGTNLERAKKIKESLKAEGGTWVGGFRGGVIDAQTWAENSFGEPVVVIAKAKKDLRANKHDTAWITLGKRAEEREGIDITMPSADLEEVRIFKIKKHKPDYVNLEEII